MKKIIYWFVSLMLISTSFSCEDFLERKPYGQVIMEDVGSETILGGLVFEIYSHLKEYDVGVFPFIGLACVTDRKSVV